MKPERSVHILGIETSCDETAAAVIRREPDGSGTVLADLVASQFDVHADFGGVVPELAARAHVSILDRLIGQALQKAGMPLGAMDAIAATAGPGLSGGLMVGLMTGKALAMAAGKPLYAINHLEGHALTATLTHAAPCPFLLLLVSGGHTQILLVEGPGRAVRWGSTIDDAAGEAFDKTAKLLGLGFPGGPAVEQAARAGDARRYRLPVPMKNDPGLDFSFSGLKTAVRQLAESEAPLDTATINDLCAAFQETVTETIAGRMSRAMDRFRTEFPHIEDPFVVAAGGVAANRAIRARLETEAARHGFVFAAPPLSLCTDNAVMIAWAAAERMAAGLAPDPLDVAPRPRWPLDALSETMIGHGKRGAKV